MEDKLRKIKENENQQKMAKEWEENKNIEKSEKYGRKIKQKKTSALKEVWKNDVERWIKLGRIKNWKIKGKKLWKKEKSLNWNRN